MSSVYLITYIVLVFLSGVC